MSKYSLIPGKELRIAISGKSGCGNTTVSTLLSQKLGIKLINYTFRQLAAEKGLTLAQVIENARICIIDTNTPIDVIHYVLDNFKSTKFYLDTVSSTKALKVKDKIGAFHTIKPNKIEAELLSGRKIESLQDMKAASTYFLNQGVQRVFISLGAEGVFYDDGTVDQLIPNPKVEVVNATGAGDAFLAALAFSEFHQYDIDKSARFAMAAAILALSYEETINPNMSQETVEKKMKEIGLC